MYIQAEYGTYFNYHISDSSGEIKMEKHPIENIMSATMENLNRMIDVDKVIGNPVISPSGETIIPVSQLSFGFACGGGEYEFTQSKKDDFPFAGGSGAGISVKPSGFLVIMKNGIKFLPIQKNTSCDKLIEFMPTLVEQIKGCKQKEDFDTN